MLESYKWRFSLHSEIIVVPTYVLESTRVADTLRLGTVNPSEQALENPEIHGDLR
jgi:hypothetical protein